MNIATGKLEAPIVKQAGMLEAITEGATGLLKHKDLLSKGLLGANAPLDSYALSGGLGTGASELVHRLGGRHFYGSAKKRRIGKALELLAAGSTGGASGVVGALAAPAMTNLRYRRAPTAARDLAQLTSLGMGGEYLSKPFLEYATGSGSGTLKTLQNLGVGAAAGSAGLAIKDRKELARQVSKALRDGKTGKDVPSRNIVQGIKRQLGMKAGLPQGTLPGLAGLGLIAGGSPILGTTTLLSAPMFNKDVSKYVGELTEELLKKKKTKETLDELYKKSSVNTTALSAPIYVTMPYCLDAPTMEKVAFGFLGKFMVNRFGMGLGKNQQAIRQAAKGFQSTGQQSAGELVTGAVNRAKTVNPRTPSNVAHTYNPEFLDVADQANVYIPGVMEGAKQVFTGGPKRNILGRAGSYLKAQTVGRARRGAAQARQSYTPMYEQSDDAIQQVTERAQTAKGRSELVSELRQNPNVTREQAPGIGRGKTTKHIGGAPRDNVTGAQSQEVAVYQRGPQNRPTGHTRVADPTKFNYNEVRTGAEAEQLFAGTHPTKSINKMTAEGKAQYKELEQFVDDTGKFRQDWYENAAVNVRARPAVESATQRTQQALAESAGNLTRRGEGAGLRTQNITDSATGGVAEAVGGAALVPFVDPLTGAAVASPSILRGARRIFDGNNIERLRGLLSGRVARGANARHLETSVLGEGTLAQLEHMQGAGAGGGALRRGVDETIKKVSDSAGLTRTSSKLRGSVESALAGNTQLTDSSRQAIIRSYEQGVAQHGAGLTPQQFREILAANTGYSSTQTATKIPGLNTIENTLFRSGAVNTAAKDLEQSVVMYRREMDALVQGQLKNRTAAGREALISNTQKAMEQPLIKGDARAEAALGRIQRITNQLVETGAAEGSVIGDQALQAVNKSLNRKNLMPKEVMELEASLKEMLETGRTTINIPGRKSINPFRRVDAASVELNLEGAANSQAVRDALQPVINLKGTQKFNPKKVMNIEAITETGVGTNAGRQAFVDTGGEATLNQLVDIAGTGKAGTKLSNKILTGEVTNAAQLTQAELQALGAGIPEYAGKRGPLANRINAVLRSNQPIEKSLEKLRTQLNKRGTSAQAKSEINSAINHIEGGLKGINSGQNPATSPDAVLTTMRGHVNDARKAAETASRRQGTVDTKLIKIEMKDQRPPLTKEQLKELAPEEIAAYNTARLEGVADSIIQSNPSVANDPLRILDEMVTLGAVKPYEKKEALRQLRRMTEPEIQAAGGPSRALSTIIGGVGIAGATGYAATKGGKGGKVTAAKQQAAKATPVTPVATASWGLSPLQAPVVYRKKLASKLAASVKPPPMVNPKLPNIKDVQPGFSAYTSTAEGINEASRRMKATSMLSAPVEY